jgi:hypothetical protein
VTVDADWDGFEADVERARQALGNFPQVAGGRIRNAVERALLLLQGKAAVYPPAPSSSTYRRTGTLGRLWTSAARVVEMGSGAFVSGRVGNATPYGPWVQDPDQQSAVHKAHGWKTTGQIVAEADGAIEQIIGTAGGEIVQDLAREIEG